MKEDFKCQPYPPARAGWVRQCKYCGDDAGTGIFCKTCKTKSGREDILKQNKEVLKNLRKLGYCLGEVLLPVC